MIKQYLEEHKEEFKPWLENNEQGRVEIKILPYLKDIENGFFVEAGALDGLFMSNTKLLEDLGWNGILVEPSAGAYAKCKENRKCIVEWAALVSKYYKSLIIYGDFFYDGDKGKGAWSSIHKNNYALEQRISVPARTLDSILKQHGVSKVDLLVLDIEGYELNALKGIDFTTTEIRYIMLEVNFNDYALEDIDEYLGKFGYKNLGPISNFTKENNPLWDASHQDYLYEKS